MNSNDLASLARLKSRLLTGVAAFAITTSAVGVAPASWASADAATPVKSVMSAADLVGTTILSPGDIEGTIYGSGEDVSIRVRADDETTDFAGKVELVEGGSVLASSTQRRGTDYRLVLPNLRPGQHQLVVRYTGDATYSSSTSESFFVTVVSADTVTTFTVPSGGVVAGGTVPIRVESPDSKVHPSGAVRIESTSGEVLGNGVAIDGLGSALLNQNLTAGSTYQVRATFLGSETHAASSSDSAPLTITARQVGAIRTEVVLSTDPAVTFVGRPYRITAQAVADQGAGPMVGTMEFYNGAEKIGEAPVGPGGHAALTHVVNASGFAMLSGRFTPNGNEYQGNSGAPLRLLVNKVNTRVAATYPGRPVARGGLMPVEVIVGPDISPLQASGPVTLTADGNTLGTGSVTNGTGTVRLDSDLAAGSHAVTLEFPTTDTHLRSSATLTVGVAEVPTRVEVTAPAPSVPVASSASLPVTVALTADSTVVPAGPLNVFENGAALGTVKLTGGAGTFPLKDLAPGTHTLKFAYAGDIGSTQSSDASVTVTVKAPSATQVSVTAPTPGTEVENTASLPVKVTAADTTITPTGKVTVTEGTTALPDVTLTAGAGSFPLKDLAPGTHTLKFAYAGDANTTGSDTTTTVTIKTPPPGKSATQVSVTAPAPGTEVENTASLPVKVTAADTTITPTGKVTVTEGTTALPDVTLTAGAGSFPLKDLAPGTHTLKFAYAGDTNTTGSDTTTTVTIKTTGGDNPGQGKSTTTTTLVLDRDSVVVGGAVAATASVSVSTGATPDGQLSFLLDGAVVATQPASSSKSVTVQLPAALTAAAGSHTVLARYDGSNTQAPSESAPRTLSVIAAPTPPTSPAAGKAAATVAVKAKASKTRAVQFAATITSTVAVAGQVKVYQSIKKGKKTVRKLVASGKITKPGTSVKLMLRTKKLKPGRRVFTVMYLGTATVNTASRTVKVRIR